MLVIIDNREDYDQSDLALTVCLCLFNRQLVVEILEHLPYFERTNELLTK